MTQPVGSTPKTSRKIEPAQVPSITAHLPAKAIDRAEALLARVQDRLEAFEKGTATSKAKKALGYLQEAGEWQAVTHHPGIIVESLTDKLQGLEAKRAELSEIAEGVLALEALPDAVTDLKTAYRRLNDPATVNDFTASFDAIRTVNVASPVGLPKAISDIRQRINNQLELLNREAVRLQIRVSNHPPAAALTEAAQDLVDAFS